MSRVRSYSFTVGRDAGWSTVTPLGIVTAERGVTVMIVVGESWEQCAETVAAYREQERAEHKDDK